jgi:nicotinamide-nucleotide amidase
VTAEIVSVGTELLLGQIEDTNATAAARVLAEAGVTCQRRQTVGDNLDRLTEAVRQALSRADLVLTIGGLGPTEDDLTREAIAAALEVPLETDDELLARLQESVQARGVPWVHSLARQALRPTGSRVLPNAIGTAVGFICEKGRKAVTALPGPPREFSAMLDEHVRPYLATRGGGVRIVSRVLRVAGMGESLMEEKVRPLLGSGNPTLAPLAKSGEAHLRITARGEDEITIRHLLDDMEGEVRARLGDVVYGVDEETLEACVLSLLRDRKVTLATAESCTGGLLGGRLTSVPGSSDVYLGGYVTYSNEMKLRALGVAERLLREHGAASEECARAMAEGARRATGADWAVSVTGIAGPTGGTPEKPVGLVFVGLADEAASVATQHRFGGDREAVRHRSTQAALALLRKAVLSGGCGSS